MSLPSPVLCLYLALSCVLQLFAASFPLAPSLPCLVSCSCLQSPSPWPPHCFVLSCSCLRPPSPWPPHCPVLSCSCLRPPSPWPPHCYVLSCSCLRPPSPWPPHCYVLSCSCLRPPSPWPPHCYVLSCSCLRPPSPWPPHCYVLSCSCLRPPSPWPPHCYVLSCSCLWPPSPWPPHFPVLCLAAVCGLLPPGPLIALSCVLQLFVASFPLAPSFPCLVSCSCLWPPSPWPPHCPVLCLAAVCGLLPPGSLIALSCVLQLFAASFPLAPSLPCLVLQLFAASFPLAPSLPCLVLQLFAASFPLAPLIALLVIMADIRIDAWRMLWMFRRPVAQIAQDIGEWLTPPLGNNPISPFLHLLPWFLCRASLRVSHPLSGSFTPPPSGHPSL